MKTMAKWIGGSLAAGLLGYLAIGPSGALYGHPLACVGVGLIGVGLMKECYDRRVAAGASMARA